MGQAPFVTGPPTQVNSTINLKSGKQSANSKTMASSKEKMKAKEKIELILANIDPTERQSLLQSLVKNSFSSKHKK